VKTVIIANPASGRFNKDKLNRCADILNKNIGDVTVKYTAKPGDARFIAAESGADMVIAAGGDGLINETAAGIAKEQLFSALPFGTVNVFCREFGIPLNPVKAAINLNTGRTKKIPLGFLGDRPFVLMCGFGYDAQVVKQVVEKGYRRYKTIAHCIEGVLSLAAPYPELTVHANGRSFNARHIIISLGQRYAGSFILSKKIKTGALNIFIQQDKHSSTLLRTILSVAIGGGFPKAPVYAAVAKISGTFSCQLDGEYINTGSDQNYVYVKNSAFTIAF
jgi:diacylglycerol kinase family enzyme